jgi:hypothetical protein
MSLRVVIQNTKLDRYTDIFFPDADYSSFAKHWESNDKFLVEMGEIPKWKFDKWSQLSTWHYQVMLLNSLNKWNQLDDAVKLDENNPVTFTFYLLLVFLSLSIETATTSQVSEIKIYLIDNKVYYNWTAQSVMINEKPNPNNVIKLVLNKDA